MVTRIPVASASTNATTPRTTGHPKKVPFLARLGCSVYSLTMLPSLLRTASAIPPVGVRIMTPSSTA